MQVTRLVYWHVCVLSGAFLLVVAHLSYIYVDQMRSRVYAEYLLPVHAMDPPQVNETFLRASSEVRIGWTEHCCSYENSVSGSVRTTVQVQWGWPFICFQGRSTQVYSRSAAGVVSVYIDAMPVPTPAWSVSSVDFVPIGIRWRGFISTLLLWLLVVVASSHIVRRLLRLFNKSRSDRRNQCLVCGYSLNGILQEAKCPECGNLKK